MKLTIGEADCWSKEIEAAPPISVNIYSHLMPGLQLTKDDLLLEEFYPGRLEHMINNLNPTEEPVPVAGIAYNDQSLTLEFARDVSGAIWVGGDYFGSPFPKFNSRYTPPWWSAEANPILVTFYPEPRTYCVSRNLRLATEIPLEALIFTAVSPRTDARALQLTSRYLASSEVYKRCECRIYFGNQFTFKGGEAIKNKEIFRGPDSLPALYVNTSEWSRG